MPTRSRMVLFALAAAVIPACASPDPLEPPAISGRQSPAVLERARRAERARALAAAQGAVAPRAVAVPPDVQATMLAALDIPDRFHPTVESIVTPDLAASAALPSLGVIQPRRGPSFLMLSTGKTADPTPAEPGFDFTPGGTDGDEVRFRFSVTVPDGVDRISFDFTFLSAESPEFEGTQFNDTFIATVSDGDGANRQIAEMSVNDKQFHEASDTTVGPSPFLLYVDNPAGVNDVFGVGVLTDAGTTGYRRVVAPIHARGQPVIIEFSIRDLGDGILDSAVLIDNVGFSSVETVDPHSAVDLIDESGHVALDPQPTATLGAPVHAVTADGATQVLVRGSLPGPGTVTFKIDSASAVDGRLSANTAPLDWKDQVTVTTVVVDGQNYAFALYQSPAAFNTGADQDKPLRSAQLTMTYTDDSGAGFDQPFTLDIVRPPVIIVPDLWTSCQSWTDTHGLMDPQPSDLRHRFSIACADYTPVNGSKGLLANANVVPDLIKQELTKLRNTGVAATRADVIGHGMGGLLARLYIDQSSFVRSDNFNEGTINRLILIDTPQLGSRLADELVRFRAFARATAGPGGTPLWTTTRQILGLVNNQLSNSGESSQLAKRILIDRCDGDRVIDDMTTTSPLINSIGTNNDPPRHVAYHVVVASTGHDIPSEGASTLDPDRSLLYTQMQNQHPSTRPRPLAQRKNLIFGPQSVIFCASPGDDHDLFTTVTEQLGGLDPESPFASKAFGVDPQNLQSGHFQIEHDHDHTRRLIDLLNAPDGSAFTTSMPPPRDQDRANHCPISIAVPVEECPSLATPPLAGAALAGSSIAIVSPAPGTTVTPGATIAVEVEARGDVPPEAVFIIAAGTVLEVEQAPFRVEVTIPRTAFDSVAVDAIALYPDGDIAFATQVPLVVNVAATLISLRLPGGDIVLPRPGSTRQLTVLGKFSDGVERDLTRAARGTRYGSSSVTPIASVSPDGLVTGLAPGNATIVARNGDVVTSINVEVGEPACGDGVLDPGEQCDDGNLTSGDGCSRTCQIDNTAPVAVCDSPTVCTDPGRCSASVTTLGSSSFDPDGDALTISQAPPGPYAVGAHTVAVTVSDGALASQCTSQLDVHDCEPPALSCPADFAVECTSDGSAPVAPPAATATDNCEVTVQPPDAGRLALGSHQLMYMASDPSDNRTHCATTVVVQDTTPPAVTCPAPTVAECTGAGQAVVDPGIAAVSDACTSTTVDRPGPSSYALGTTPVTYAATDEAGNRASCTTSVTVQDTTPPDITCPAPIRAECIALSLAFVRPGSATSSDVCTAVTVAGPHTGLYPLGVTPITYTATDQTGNQASCHTAIEVVDTRPAEVFVTRTPVLSNPDHQYRTVSLDDCGISVLDACGGELAPSTYQPAITCVTSDEPDDAAGSGDGRTTNDIVLVDRTRVRLRAERDGSRDGRTYKIHFRVQDRAGNPSEGTCTVLVPHDPDCDPRSADRCRVRDSGVASSVCAR